MKRNQGKLAAIFSAAISGLPNIFFPLKFRKGNATREPADLVWYVNGTVILIYMKGSVIYETLEKKVSNTNRIHEQNLNQARGWLRTWRGGEVLRGRNDYKNLDLPYSDSLNVIVLSIYGTGVLEAKLDDNFTYENNISACAMLPEEAIAHMAGATFSPVDILNILLRLKVECNKKVENILTVLNEYFGEGKTEVDKALKVIKGKNVLVIVYVSCVDFWTPFVMLFKDYDSQLRRKSRLFKE